MIPQKNILIGAGFALFALSVWAVIKARPGQSAMSSLAENIGNALGGAVVDAATGAVVGVYESLPEQIQPSSDKNVIYGGANQVYRWFGVLGDDETIGTKIYDWTH